ncbi:MAG: UDP-N-acetylmuramoyl-L-alanyl-D-glutamate--2,6-diaminopimelate ligase [Alphaproteobacteria bacterium]|nr:MAG: UDP-N-acetylmuramoyl-L-alanyl-D-glutamate--2,6-diaminopimelate ligase [Alphaproteobacteria bacterium]
MLLKELLSKVEPLSKSEAEIDVTGLTADSRAVAEGYLFAALEGTAVDGAKFIPQAKTQGAAAVITHEGWQTALGEDALADIDKLPVIPCREPRQALAIAAARFFGAQPDVICAVTGTNGKTSIASFVRQLWTLLGHQAASLGTLGVESPAGLKPLHHTTPDPVEIHEKLRDLVKEGVTHLAVEASSHGLAQYRLDGVKMQAGAFTNLSRDHLDYHKDFDEYLDAKMRLFQDLLAPGAPAILNADMDIFAKVEERCLHRGLKVVSIGKAGKTIRIVEQISTASGQTLGVEWDGKVYKVDLPLAGGFQALNALMAAALVVSLGAQIEEVMPLLAQLKGASGRLELVGDLGNRGVIYIDYAHTPDALETVLKALRPHTEGDLHVVVGCGGDRDKGKRPLMGEIASRLADFAIITDDNPRCEDAATIRAEVMAGVKRGGAHVDEIGDRREAIRAAIDSLEDGDILVIAGKGHESGQIVGDKVLPFNDKAVVQEILAETGGGR